MSSPVPPPLQPNAGVPVNANDPTNIWYEDLPTDLQGIKIFYSVGQHTQTEHIPEHGSVYNEQVPLGPGQTAPTPSTKAITTASAYDNNVTPQDILKQVAALQYNDPQQLASIQTLMSGGAWGTVHVNGVFDKDTEDAIIKAMQYYYKTTKSTGTAISFMDYLQTAGTNALQAKASSSGSSTPPRITDPAYVRAQAQNAAQNALGRSLSQSELNQFVSQFTQSQMSDPMGSDPYNMTMKAPAESQAFAENVAPQEFASNQRTQYLDALVNLMGGNRPSAQEPVGAVTKAGAEALGAPMTADLSRSSKGKK